MYVLTKIISMAFTAPFQNTRYIYIFFKKAELNKVRAEKFSEMETDLVLGKK